MINTNTDSDSDSLQFHYRALAAAGDPLAERVIKGMELVGATMIEHTVIRYASNDHIAARFLTIDQSYSTREIACEMKALGWAPALTGMVEINRAWRFDLRCDSLSQARI